MATGLEHVATGPGIHEVVVLMNVLVIGAIFYLGAKKGIVASLKLRSESVREKLMESKTELAKVESALNAAKSELKDFENTRNRMIAEVRSEAEHLSHTILEEASGTAARILQDAKLSAKSEARGAVNELKKALVSAALSETRELIAQSKDQQATVHKQLFEMMNNDIKGAQSHGR